MAMVLSNNASSLLAVAILSTDTSLTITSGDEGKFPVLGVGDWFPLTAFDGAGNMEIMKVTARTGTLLTVVRGQEGTTARGFSAGARVDSRITAGTIGTLRHENNLSDLDDKVVALETLSAKIAAISALTWLANTFVYFTDATTPVLGSITAWGRSLAAAADAAAGKIVLGLVPGSDVQAYSSKLTTIAALTWAADKVMYFTSASAAALTTLSAYGRTIIAVADQAAFTALVAAATTTLTGAVKKATSAEMMSGASDAFPDAALIKANTVDSPEFSLVNGSTGIWSHGMSAKPRKVTAWVRMKTARDGKVVDEEIPVPILWIYGSGSYGAEATIINSTQCRYTIASFGVSILKSDTSIGALVTPANADMKLFLRAEI